MIVAALAAGLAVPAADVAVQACGYGRPSPQARFLAAEVVVAGRVIAVEDQNVAALPFATAQKDVEYTVAIVHVTRTFKGAPGNERIRVGLMAPHQGLRPGQEVLLFLTRHFEEPFFIPLSGRFDYAISKDNNPDFDRQLAQHERWAKAWNDPAAALTAKDQTERLHAAIMAVERHRLFQPAIHRAAGRMQPLDAVRSEQILRALAEVDWARGGPDFRMSPWRAFNMLGATAKDGWSPQPGWNTQQLTEAARRWLGEHATTFRIAALVER
jgi:hypothetical protein